MFKVAYRTLLVMFYILEFYFVDLNHGLLTYLFKAAKFGSLCKVEKNSSFQNKTLLVLFYRENKTY